MKRYYTISLEVEVTDKALLLATARTMAREEGMNEEDAVKDVNDALRWLFDPGVSPDGTKIIDSSVE